MDQIPKNGKKVTIIGIFIELLSTQNINIARSARVIEWDFLVIFKHCGVNWISRLELTYWVGGLRGPAPALIADLVIAPIECL